MKRAFTVMFISIALLLLALLWPRLVESEGFQSSGVVNQLPTGNVTITHFVIYGALNTIMNKLPFVHSNFSKVSSYDTASLSSPLVQTPSTDPAMFQDLTRLVNTDSVPKLWAFELKNAIIGPLDQASVDALDDASNQLFQKRKQIAFRTGTGRLFPAIEFDTGGSTASTGGSTASTGGSTASTGGSTASTGDSTASTGGSTASTGGSTASTGGSTASTGGSTASTSAPTTNTSAPAESTGV